MKVFLSGKIDREAGDWRTPLLGTYWNEFTRTWLPKWVFSSPPVNWDDAEERSVGPWPLTVGAVLGRYDYVGPYRQERFDDPDTQGLGVFHGTGARGQHGVMDPDLRRVVLERCERAIQAADLVFAFLNRADAFGTLVEIGYAAVLGKYVVVYSTDGATKEWDDYWFAEQMASSNIYLPEWEKLTEHEQAKQALEQGILNFAGAVLTRTPTGPLTAPSTSGPPVGAAVIQSFSQIARWSSDPRVRDEATRMLHRLQG